MTRVLLPFPLQRTLTDAMAPLLGARTGRLDWRHFPDGESLVTIEQDLDGVDVALVASLRNPDELALPLRFAAATAREFGARSIGLIAPYLAYMRQDKRFNPGEAVSAPMFARFLADSFDWLVTADPHLHRIPRLSELFRIPARAVATAPLISEWIRDNIPNAVLIGPDGESSQWVSDVADRAGVAYQILAKIRRGDRGVDVSLPSIDAARSRTPIIVDDIASSGRTMIETLNRLRQLGLPPAVCIVIHPVFAQNAYAQLLGAGAERVVSTDSIPHVERDFPRRLAGRG
ncbi:ribose-phosphate diphosphokinase [Mesorhizobium sp. M0139]|uniref:ribose-phosphate diphosphokinase n=1 Tax=Mesorhizobium sp. M0139 TaxID=2956892 RepID=UPI0033384B8F